MSDEIQNESEVYQVRKQKLAELRHQGFDFPNQFRRGHFAQDLLDHYATHDKTLLEHHKVNVCLAGRIVLRRVMGKASFFHLQDPSGRIQVYLRANDLPEIYESFKRWDLGDIVGVEGYLFITNTGELTIHATAVTLLVKSLRPLPDKFHGLTDHELRYRKRYLDLMVNEQSRCVFKIRTQVIQTIRRFMDQQGFLEVETPMMHPIPGGALARPFKTHHHALGMDMFLRIAPELYLKRLIVSGFERVYEINRNFRNEGISTRHNPEFTMMEFYQAYADYHDLIQLTETLLVQLCEDIFKSRQITYQGHYIEFVPPFAQYTLTESLLKFNPTWGAQQIHQLEACRALLDNLGFSYQKTDGIGKLQVILFEETVEHQLIQPTFITHYPLEVSPLARPNAENPTVTDRFELFIVGREMANGFSELNDAEDQASRFQKQVEDKNAGDLEAMHYDSDFIEALEYGMPPTAGEGIGIDRLVMLLTDSPSIRDVILFPQLRRE